MLSQCEIGEEMVDDFGGLGDGSWVLWDYLFSTWVLGEAL